MKKRNLFRIYFIVSISTALFANINGDAVRYGIKTNGEIVYFTPQKHADTFIEMFSQGDFYGRLRSNNFYWRWKNEDEKHNSHFISGLGGSLLYSSAFYNGFRGVFGLYYSRGFFSSSDPYNLIKAGKDVASRYDYLKSAKKDLAVLGQAYVEYTARRSRVRVGRQLVETFYTRSNDTKMIPNTFDGVTLYSEALSHTQATVGYLVRQKLRDHSKEHPLFTYGDCAYDNCFDDTNALEQLIALFSANDDSAMHRGLSYTRLKAANKPTDAPLIVVDVVNQTYMPLRTHIAAYVVPELLWQITGEIDYTFSFGALRITPGVRYIQQFDEGAGKVGGASLSGQVSQSDPKGYSDPTSLESSMLGVRLVANYRDTKLNIAYTAVADEADLVTPWRGFPTSGYTRSMGRYNWKANTKSYRLEVVQNANAIGIYKNLFIQASILYTDYDEKKEFDIINDTIKYSDETYYYLGFVQNLPALPQLQWKLRLGYTSYADAPLSDYDNLDSRFEINYVF